MDSHSDQEYRLRRGELSAFGRAMNSARDFSVLLFAVAVMVLAVVLYFVFRANPESTGFLAGGFAAVLIGGLFYSVWSFARRHFIEPDLAYRKWLQQVCDGELDARIDLPVSHRHYKELNFHTRNLAMALSRLSTDMENLVESQTHRLEDQKQALEFLFKLTTDVAAAGSGAELLQPVCERLAKWLDQSDVCGYLLEDNELLQVARFTSRSDMTASDLICPELRAADLPDEICYRTDEQTGDCSIGVPFRRGDAVAGLVTIQSTSASGFARSEVEPVLITVSEQLTLFLNKMAALEQAGQHQLLAERARLAGDIHDSLAQTLLAARYKLSLLKQSFTDKDHRAHRSETEKIEATIEDANAEIRQLISEYRRPLSVQRNAEGLRAVIDQFRDSTGNEVFFQSDTPQLQFTALEETVVHRIVHEALMNAHKHADATMMRVYLQHRSNGIRVVLIEDDGSGFEFAPNTTSIETTANASEHVGLQLMRERATSVGAHLSIESEPGEGTRVTITLPPHIQSAPHTQSAGDA